MKYSSLKRQAVKSFKVNALDGGVNLAAQNTALKNGEVTSCSNMWYKDLCLQTRPGFISDINKVYKPEINGYFGKLRYKVTDYSLYLDDIYYRIATADVLSDDYAHYTYVCLVDNEDNIKPIGSMAFLRLSSDIFYTPENILFFSGKSENGGIFAFVTLRNIYDYSQKNYGIYEVNSDYTEWERVYDYYVPTVSINGRGNKYQIARAETGLNLAAPQSLESLNMLNGRFNAYFSSDGFSNSFKLPFANLAEEKIVCKIYYTLVDFAEWEIPANANTDTKEFFGQEVRAVIDREKGVIYFVSDGGEFAIPLMDLYNENNIKITATKEVKNGFAKVVHSSCIAKSNTKSLLSGGMDGNTVYICDYDNPLYFPKSSVVTVGDGDSSVIALASQEGKILAFKSNEIHLLTLKNGNPINETALLSDNDKIFKNYDKITSEEICKGVGCVSKDTIATCKKATLWLSEDNVIYLLDSVNSKNVIAVSDYPKALIYDNYYDEVFGLGNDDYYIFIVNGNMVVFDIKNIKSTKMYLWQKSDELVIGSGFYHNGEFRFLCGDRDGKIAFVSRLSGDKDKILFCEDGAVKEKYLPIKSSVKTKKYLLSDFTELKNVDSIYVSMAACGKVEIEVNSKPVAKVNFDYSNDDYGNLNYKTVRLLPQLYSVRSIQLGFESQEKMRISEFEIMYRKIG